MAKRGPKKPSKWDEAAIEALIPSLKSYARVKKNVIVSGWLAKVHINRCQILEFKERSPKFANAYEDAFQELERHIVERGYTENSAMSIFLLKSTHGHRDKQEIEHTGSLGISVIFEEAKPPKQQETP